MVDLGEAKGIEVIFVVVPGNSQRNPRVLQHGHALPEGHFLDITEPERHPEFYLHENKFDRNHLNKSGARRMSAVLASEFVALIDNL